MYNDAACIIVRRLPFWLFVFPSDFCSWNVRPPFNHLRTPHLHASRHRSFSQRQEHAPCCSHLKYFLFSGSQLALLKFWQLPVTFYQLPTISQYFGQKLYKSMLAIVDCFSGYKKGLFRYMFRYIHPILT